jgi:hypothetical protein
MGGAGYHASRGGGAIKINANDLFVNGTIDVDGGAVNYAGGAGGSIWVDVHKLHGFGAFTSNGGRYHYSWRYGGGSGGRIAVYATENTRNITMQAYGGFGSNADGHAAHGSIYINDNDKEDRLIYKNNRITNRVSQIFSGDDDVDVLEITTLELRYGANVNINNLHKKFNRLYRRSTTVVVGEFFSYNPDVGVGSSSSATRRLTVSSGCVFFITNTGIRPALVEKKTASVIENFISSTTLRYSSNFNITEGIELTNVRFDIYGYFRHPVRMNLTGDAYIRTYNKGLYNLKELQIFNKAVLVVDHTLAANGNNGVLPLYISEKLVQHDSSELYLYTNVCYACRINLNVPLFQGNSGTLHFAQATINANTMNILGKFKVDGYNRGYYHHTQHPSCYSSRYSGYYGGSHAGSHGRHQAPSCGSHKEPTYMGGAGYHSSRGGGAIKIVASTLLVNGTINVNGGAINYAGGAGGSIWIDVNRIEGYGSISANGGRYHYSWRYGGGSGGRIAVHANYDDGYKGSYSACGGFGSDANGHATAGSIYHEVGTNRFARARVIKYDNCNRATTYVSRLSIDPDDPMHIDDFHITRYGKVSVDAKWPNLDNEEGAVTIGDLYGDKSGHLIVNNRGHLILTCYSPSQGLIVTATDRKTDPNHNLYDIISVSHFLRGNQNEKRLNKVHITVQKHARFYSQCSIELCEVNLANNADGFYGAAVFSNCGNATITGPVDILGCTSSAYKNYNPRATVNDGSCTNIINDYPEVLYCNHPLALNYYPDGYKNDVWRHFGNCMFRTEIKFGCVYPYATNYNRYATVDNGSCNFVKGKPRPFNFNNACMSYPCINGGRCRNLNTVANRYMYTYNNWRKKYLGKFVELPVDTDVGVYGSEVESWDDCSFACRANPDCAQVVYNKKTKECYPMSQSSQDDQDNKGGSNTDFISAIVVKLNNRVMTEYNNWRKDHTEGTQLPVNYDGAAYGAVVGSWQECSNACRYNPLCKQVVYKKDTRKCYPMSKANVADQDGIGGDNTNWISAQVYNPSNHTYSCSCRPGWEGLNCHIDIDDCASNPCLHGACYDRLNGFRCVCEPNWFGRLCNAPPRPTDGTCTDNAHCENGDCVDNYCFCKPGWAGIYCDRWVDPRPRNNCPKYVEFFAHQYMGTGYLLLGNNSLSLRGGTMVDEVPENVSYNKTLHLPRNNYIYGHNSALYLGSADFDIAMTIKVNGHANNIVGVSAMGYDRVQNGYMGYTVQLFPGGYIAFKGSCNGRWGGGFSSGCQFVQGKYYYKINEWFTFSVERRAGEFRVFANGILQQEVVRSSSYSFHSSSGGFHINHVNSGCCHKYGTSDINVAEMTMQKWTHGHSCTGTKWDYCNPNPCLNGGTCYGNGYCKCINGYTGYRCHVVPPSPGDGTCTHRQHCNGGICSYGRCINCPNRYSGWYCHIPPRPPTGCSHDTHCGKYGTCRNGRCICTDYWSGEHCHCPPRPPKGCTHDLHCSNGGYCSDGLCVCKNGWLGEWCQTNPPLPPNGCYYNAHCNGQGTCVNNFCVCINGFTGDFCTNPPPLPPVGCGHNYHCNGGYCTNNVCRCLNGYTGDFCQYPPPTKDDRCTHDIHCNGGKCYNNYCTCLTGYWGRRCQNRPPRDDTGGCKYNYHCGVGVCSSGVCVCPANWSGRYCNVPKLPPTVYPPNSCSHDGHCHNGGYCSNRKCTCQYGYFGPYCESTPLPPKKPCTHNDHCFSGSCSNNKCVCINGFTGWRCSDPPQLPPTGCTYDYHCGDNGNCVNSTCVCINSFTGTYCQNEPPYKPDCSCCAVDWHCKNGGTCNDGTCICANGYTGKFCDIPPLKPDCGCCTHNSHCNGGTCANNICYCINGFTGKLCTIPPRPDGPKCSHNDHCNVGSCVDELCVCRDSFTGDYCDIPPQPPGPACSHDSHCRNGGSCWTGRCKCINNYFGDYCTIPPRPDEPKCNDNGHCHNGGTCSSAGLCVCINNWSGYYCKIPPRPEGPKCSHNAHCINGSCINGRCRCLFSWGGHYCDTQPKPKPRNNCRNSVYFRADQYEEKGIISLGGKNYDITGGKLLSDAPSGFGKSLNFPRNNFVTGSAVNDLLLGKDNFDLSIVMKINDHSNNIVGTDIFGVNQHQRGYYGYSLTLHPNKFIAFYTSCNGGWDGEGIRNGCHWSSGKYEYTLNKWFKYTIQRRGEKISFFIDNDLLIEKEVNASFSIHTSSGGFHINTLNSGCCNRFGSSDISIAEISLQKFSTSANCVQLPWDPCSPNPCQNGGTCNNGRCSCKEGFTGYRCHIIPPRPPAPKCSHNTHCVHGICTNGLCLCEGTYSGDYCDTPPKPDAPHCSHNSHCANGAQCRNRKCICVNGWTGNYCDVPPVPPDGCTHDGHCNNGNCTSAENGKCVCPEGWKGTHCECPPPPKKGCLHNLHCSNGGLCVNGACVCVDGYSGEKCDVNPPPPTGCTHNNHCLNGGICTNGACVCINNFTGDKCEIPPKGPGGECTHNAHCVNGICKNNVCTCHSGYSGDLCNIPPLPPGPTPTGPNCAHYNHCNGGTCTNGLCVCINGFTGYYCKIPPKPKGPYCATNSHCNGGVCGSNNRCICPTGYSGDYCTIPPKPDDGCNHHGHCNGGNCTNGVCVCLSGFSGDFCDNEPPKPDDPNCTHDVHCRKGKCSGGLCVCPSGWTGNYCETPPNDPPPDCGCCTHDVHCNGGTCSGGKCICKNGYTGDTCLIPPPVPEPCGCCTHDSQCNGGKCSDGKCICINSYTGKFCEIPPIVEKPECEVEDTFAFL